MTPNSACTNVMLETFHNCPKQDSITQLVFWYPSLYFLSGGDNIRLSGTIFRKHDLQAGIELRYHLVFGNNPPQRRTSEKCCMATFRQSCRGKITLVVCYTTLFGTPRPEWAIGRTPNDNEMVSSIPALKSSFLHIFSPMCSTFTLQRYGNSTNGDAVNRTRKITIASQQDYYKNSLYKGNNLTISWQLLFKAKNITKMTLAKIFQLVHFIGRFWYDKTRLKSMYDSQLCKN